MFANSSKIFKTLFFSRFGQLIDKELDLFEVPNVWDVNEHYLIHKRSKVYFWIANGFWFFQTKDCGLKLNLIERFFIYRKFKNNYFKYFVKKYFNEG